MTCLTKAKADDTADERSPKKRKTGDDIAMAATPRRETTDAARDTVFKMPELLENIISCLPPRDILTVVQRLSHRWADAVDSSRTIKAKLGIRSQGVTASRPARFTDVQTFP